MTNFLPYAIVAGIVIVFFVVCYIMFSGGSTEDTKDKKHGGTSEQPVRAEKRASRPLPEIRRTGVRQRAAKGDDTAPLPHITTVNVRERKEDPSETAFVTTKGEAVRRSDGEIVYAEAATHAHKKLREENLEATRVLSREEILAAMDKVDKEEAAAYRAKAAEEKREREQQRATIRHAEEIHIARDQQVLRNERKQQRLQREEERLRQNAANSVDHGEAQTEPLADMAAVISADLAAKQHAEQAASAGKQVSVVKQVMEETKRTAVRDASSAQAESENPAACSVSDETQMLRPSDLASHINKKSTSSAAGAVTDQTLRMDVLHAGAAAAVSDDTAAGLLARKKHTARQHAAAEQSHQSPWGSDASGITAKPGPLAGTGKRNSIWNADEVEESPVVKQCASHFLNQFGLVTPELQQQIRYITAAAFHCIGCDSDSDRKQAVTPVLVQEALQNVQKAYAAHPDTHVEALALQAFYDIVHCPAVSTRHLVAVDALKVMPYLSREHYKILAVLLLFLYSRNAHNVDKETFCQYIDTYVLPFVDGFPTERPYYQQLDYLHCTAFEGKETHFAEILADSYPLLFRYRGITEEELRKALKGKRIPNEFIVQSFNSPLIKLAMVDESMAARFFRLTGIADRNMQDHILRLAKKRPASFSGEEALDIMEDISPILADLGDIWDSSMLRVSTLSLLGLYLAQGFVKETIGEEFDLSRWFE